MSKKQKRMLFRVLASAVLFAVALLLPTEGWLRLFTFLIPYAVIAWDVLWRAVRNIAHGQVFDENFLMSIATLAAFAIGDFAEAVGVMLFYRCGELFEDIAVEKSRGQIMDAVDMRPEVVNLLHGDEVEVIPAEEAQIGDVLLVRVGDRIPLDGVI